MLLGGLRYLLPVIESAHKLGYYVITCDYLPDNIAHKYSDEYCNVSIIDKEAVLAVAREKEIDGIMSFAVDPGVVTAAYVAEQLGLPFAGSYEAVQILQNKDRFRQYLTENGFNVPKAKGYVNFVDAIADIGWFDWPVIVKPTDSAGSKGVVKVEDPSELEAAFQYAMDHSLSGHVIIEEFIEKQGCSSDTDSFSVNGELKFVSFSAQRFDDEAANPYTPSAYSWPSTFTEAQECELRAELQRLVTLLGLKTSIYNIETRIGTNGKPYIMEVSPRGGGNRLAEVLRYATGVDLITNYVKASVGEPVEALQHPVYKGAWAEVILHADKDGVFDLLAIDEKVKKENLVELDLWVSPGDNVRAFNGANDAIGTLIMQFNSQEELTSMLAKQRDWLKVIVRNNE